MVSPVKINISEIRFVKRFMKWKINVLFLLTLGEEWGKKRKGKGRRRKKKVMSDSDEGVMSSDDSEPKSKRSKKQKETGFTKTMKLSEDLEAVIG